MSPLAVANLILLALIAVFVVAVLMWHKGQRSGFRGVLGSSPSGGFSCQWYTNSPVWLDDDGRVYNLMFPTSGCHSAWAAARDWDGERDPDYPYTSGAFFCLSNTMSTSIQADSSGNAIYLNVEPLVLEVEHDKRKRQLRSNDEFKLYTYQPHYQWKQKVMLQFADDERQFVNSDYPSGVLPGPDDITFHFSDHSCGDCTGDLVYYGDTFKLKVKQDDDAHVKVGPGSCDDLYFPQAFTTNSCGSDVEFLIQPYPGTSPSS
jgi:hypothetical protein